MITYYFNLFLSSFASYLADVGASGSSSVLELYGSNPRLLSFIIYIETQLVHLGEAGEYYVLL